MLGRWLSIRGRRRSTWLPPRARSTPPRRSTAVSLRFTRTHILPTLLRFSRSRGANQLTPAPRNSGFNAPLLCYVSPSFQGGNPGDANTQSVDVCDEQLHCFDDSCPDRVVPTGGVPHVGAGTADEMEHDSLWLRGDGRDFRLDPKLQRNRRQRGD